MLLEIKDLHVKVGERKILKGVSLTLEKGQTQVLMGPNACGKTTLVMAILGYPSYKITQGRILFEGEDLVPKDISERTRMGIALAYQNPPEIRGVKLRDILGFITERFSPGFQGEEATTYYLQRIKLDPPSFLDRDINLGFSGGEKKRAELAQVFAMRPKLMILDEPDSGVDIDSLKQIGTEIKKAIDELGCGMLVITHHRHILQYLDVDLCHIMYDGRIIISGTPKEIIPQVGEMGYEGFKNYCRT